MSSNILRRGGQCKQIRANGERCRNRVRLNEEISAVYGLYVRHTSDYFGMEALEEQEEYRQERDILWEGRVSRI